MHYRCAPAMVTPRSSTVFLRVCSHSSLAAPTSLCWTAVSGGLSWKWLMHRKGRTGHGDLHPCTLELSCLCTKRCDLLGPLLPLGRGGGQRCTSGNSACRPASLDSLPSWSHLPLLLLLCQNFWESFLINPFPRYLHLGGGFGNPNYNINLRFSPIGASKVTVFFLSLSSNY